MYTKLETGVSQRNFPTSGEPPSTEIPTRIHQEMMSSKAASSNGAQGPRQAMSRDDLESRSSFLLDDIPHIVAAEQTRENVSDSTNLSKSTGDDQLQPTSNAAESSDNARGSNDPIFATTRMDPVTRRLELSHDDLRSPDELPQIVVSLSESAPQPREGAEKKKKKRGSFLDKLRERSDGSSTNHRGGLRSGPMQGERPKSLPWAVARRSC
ncbi:hypothetical protein BU26DRAFT_286699 [Trematosphaeria pertusa]|uniref:Uncharacterized protein n=1 Tax=Trematosphaeria pertusa TaxID=390896 RepID=A0A6A6IJ89_9PLEO|nr:uncharacterized protein BU26DRAFT_286699 [Trematosphaeria pertusa]KAF2249613.1 hypothetical protein BU26DRAFT_286699 [Trematosphaeria pertusa]